MSGGRDRWARVGDIFCAALDTEPEKRADLIMRLTGGDQDLASEVRELLSAHFDGGHFDRLSEEVGAPQPAPDAPSHRRDRIGPYEVVEEVGRGGMGAVFRARRADGQFEQEVALKLHRADVYRSELRDRFLSERQILALISHPNIARLLDGGVTEDGRSYFAMEYVEGLPLDHYCDTHRLTVAERLRLFRSVCDAVQHAHQNLVVHRDLKPSNILVTDDGTVKLLDFGIAKLLDAGGARAATDATQAGSRMLTPDYASPEQIQGGPVTTATDVYQLGVLLFELLTGVRPHDLRDASLLELERSVLLNAPPLPSSAVGRPHDTAGSPDVRASRRGTRADRLARALRGDLDAIVHVAMQHEPERRFDSAAGLSEEIERYLDGHPVKARRSSRWYRAAKFVRRNRTGVAATLALLLGGGLFSAERARQVRATETALAQSEQVTDFLVSLFQSSNPEVTRGDTPSLRQVLDYGADRVRTELADDPAVQTRLMGVIAEVYETLALPDPATALRREALAIREASLPEDHPDVATASVQLATLLASRGDADAARVALDDAERRLEVARLDDRQRALNLNNLGFGWQVIGERDRAQRHYESSIALHRSLSPPVPARVSPLINLGHIRLGVADPDSAEALFREGLAIRRSLFEETTADVANVLLALARAVQARGALAEADSLVREVMRIRREIYPPGHPMIGTLIVQRASILNQLGRPEESDALYREAIEGMEISLGSDDAELALARNDRGVLLNTMGRFEEAERVLRPALSVFEERYGPTHVFSSIVRSNLAEAVAGRGGFTEAERLFLRALTDLEAADGQGRATANLLADWAEARIRARDLPGAAEKFSAAIAVLLETEPESDPDTQRTRNRLGAVLTALERYEESEAVLLAAYAAAPEETRSYSAQGLVALYEAWGRPAAADRYR